MVKERFRELSDQLHALTKRSRSARNSQERHSLLREKRAIVKQIDELVRTQAESSGAATQDS
jgi:hypothetical protein